MSQPFSRTKLLDISNYLDVSNELLNLPSSSEHSILIVGPDLVRREVAIGKGYMERLLKRIVEWCIQEKIIQDQDIIQDLHTLLQNGALVPLAFRIEEYLATKQLKEQCLHAVLSSDNQVRKIHRDLVRVPHRGYVTTSYDTCIETAYAQHQRSTLPTFYPSSIAQAIKASQKKQPFILKLYGDIDDPDSIRLSQRLLTGLYTEDVREQLRQLFSETLAIFVDFDEADEDYIALQSLAKDRIFAYPNQPTCIVEKVISDNLIGFNYYARSNSETLPQSDVLIPANTPFEEGNPESVTTSSKSPTHPATKQNNHRGMKQDNKKLIDVCIYYASKDDKYKEGIEEVLDALKKKKDRCFEIEYISWAMGTSLGYTTDIRNPLISKQLVILLISQSFLAGYDEKQMEEVVIRHQRGAWISPILVRPCDWQGHQFIDTLERYILPQNKIPISSWKNLNKDEDDAYANISKCLEKALDDLASS